jgi:hypothetical protein
MQTALGEHARSCKLRGRKDARGARAITVTILAIAALGHYHNLAGLEATENLPMYEGKNKKGTAPLGSFISF